MDYTWFEHLPEQCPPKEAKPCNGIYYRIAKGVPTESEDYFSQRMLQPEKIFQGEGIDECILRAVSVFDNPEMAQKRLKLPKFKSQVVIKVVLSEKDGVMKKTFGPSHYSWWRSVIFNYVQTSVI